MNLNDFLWLTLYYTIYYIIHLLYYTLYYTMYIFTITVHIKVINKYIREELNQNKQLLLSEENYILLFVIKNFMIYDI